ncbi:MULTISPECIES: helix-turn-helix domain-containing protein [Burkholderia]|uniref:helix-turn-helix domain-containing protein n=1 Tax=Burkholderia TaxID=32008 RepID=UPI0012BD559D|nr:MULTISPECIES: LysR family transcriptional regulator [Burkholderia]
MDRFESVSVFVEIVSTGGLSTVTERLGLSPGMVDKHLNALEMRLDVKLLHRTTVATSSGRGRSVISGAKPDYCRARYIINGDNPTGSGHPGKAEEHQFFCKEVQEAYRGNKMIAKFIVGVSLALTLTANAMAGGYEIPGLEVCDANSVTINCPIRLDGNGFFTDRFSGARLYYGVDLKGLSSDATLYGSMTKLILEYSNASSSKNWTVLIFFIQKRCNADEKLYLALKSDTGKW